MFKEGIGVLVSILLFSCERTLFHKVIDLGSHVINCFEGAWFFFIVMEMKEEEKKIGYGEVIN